MLHSAISNRYFQIIFIPITLLIIGVLARRLGRRDGDDSPRLNDWAVGTSVLLMAFSALLADFKNITTPDEISNQLCLLIGLMFSAFISIDHDRFRSWERANDGLPTKKKKLMHGIVFPNVLCVSVFAFYQAFKIGVL